MGVLRRCLSSANASSVCALPLRVASPVAAAVVEYRRVSFALSPVATEQYTTKSCQYSSNDHETKGLERAPTNRRRSVEEGTVGTTASKIQRRPQQKRLRSPPRHMHTPRPPPPYAAAPPPPLYSRLLELVKLLGLVVVPSPPLEEAQLAALDRLAGVLAHPLKLLADGD